MKLLRALALALCLFSSAWAIKGDPFKSLPQEDQQRPPFVIDLPCDDGRVVAYTFSVDVTQRQAFWLLAAHLEFADFENRSYHKKVYIIAFAGPKKRITVTADFKTNQLEIRHERVGKNHFFQKRWEGDIRGSLEYLSQGHQGNPKIIKGFLTKEILPKFNPDDPCVRLQEL